MQGGTVLQCTEGPALHAPLAGGGDRRLRDRRCLDGDADGAGQLHSPRTSPKVFRLPTPIEDAVAFVDALLASPGVHLATSGTEWSKWRQLRIDRQLTGNDLPDAWLAAAVSCLGEHLESFDRDFRKLPTRSQFTLLAPG